MHEYENVVSSGGTRRRQVFLQPVELSWKQSPKWIARMLLRPAGIPIVRIELGKMAAGVIEAVNAAFIRRKARALRFRSVHRVYKLRREDSLGALLALLIHLRAI